MKCLLERSDAIRRATLSDGHTQWSYADLTAAVSQWCEQLDALDSRVVAFDLDNGLERAALDLALLDSGRTAIPLPGFFSDSQKAHVLHVVSPDLLITRDNDYPVSTPEFTSASEFRHVTLHPRALHQRGNPHMPAQTAVVTFTSGTTGTPKGVCLSRKTLLNTADGLYTAMGDLGVRKHLSVLPLGLLLENVAGLYANLLNGSEICMPALHELGLGGSSQIDLAAFIGALNRHEPDSIILVPALLLALTTASELGFNAYRDYKMIAVGGGKVAPALLARAKAAQLAVFEGYGLTECGSVIAVNLPAAERPGSVGRWLPHVQAECRNGELLVHEPRMLGYLYEDGFEVAQTPYATGDLGDVDKDGFVSISGRARHLFITAFGRNVSPEWVESELTSEMSIAHAQVFGEGAEHCAALLVPRNNATDTELQAAVERANARLPDYARVLRWQVVQSPQLSEIGALTPNGRLRRKVLEQTFSADLAAMLTPFPASGMTPNAATNA